MASRSKTGARGLRFMRGSGHPVVYRACLRYGQWLRRSMDFPLRVDIRFSGADTVWTDHGRGISVIGIPYKRADGASIRIATGDYEELRRERGRNGALERPLNSLSMQLVRYFQWVEGRETERGVQVKARNMLHRYLDDVIWP